MGGLVAGFVWDRVSDPVRQAAGFFPAGDSHCSASFCLGPFVPTDRVRDPLPHKRRQQATQPSRSDARFSRGYFTTLAADISAIRGNALSGKRLSPIDFEGVLHRCSCRNTFRRPQLCSFRNVQEDSAERTHSLQRRNSSAPFVPPKPKEFDMAYSSLALRAWLGTKSIPAVSGSWLTRLMVGGRI